MAGDLIVVRQLPVIEDNLRAFKGQVEQRVRDALALTCTEANYKEIKKVRSELGKEFKLLDPTMRLRLSIKTAPVTFLPRPTRSSSAKSTPWNPASSRSARTKSRHFLRNTAKVKASKPVLRRLKNPRSPSICPHPERNCRSRSWPIWIGLLMIWR